MGRLAAALACAVALAAAAPAAAQGLQPGAVLDQATAGRAADLLPPEILAHYQKGEYRHEIVEWPLGRGTMGPAYAAETARNAEGLTADEAGTVVERVTGQQPRYVYGTPFPRIDPGDPGAGVKLVWNYFYANSWWNANVHSVLDLLWFGRSGVDRSATQEVFCRYYDGVPPDVRPAENPNNLLVQCLASTTRPADLQGTAALSWRYRDPRKRDSVWTYVPALRRVRPGSPTNRSDGFLGSDLSQDDGTFFDGKPEDFTWTLAGEREILRFIDPFRLSGDVQVLALPGGGWRALYKSVPAYGFQDKEWTGVAWAPVAHKLARRKVWVVEGVPKDHYYLYGRIQLLIDQENWQGAFNRKFSWQGDLLNTLLNAGGPAVGVPDGIHFFTTTVGSGELAYLAENVRLGRATGVAVGPEGVNERMVPLEASAFSVRALARQGK